MSDAQKAKNRPAVPARILVVEDQDSIRELARAVLTGAGHDVAVAVNGAEAVAAVRDAHFDLILMDVQMPVMDGPTAVRQIRSGKGLKSKVPIIAMSGARSGVPAGMDDFICKPFRKAALLLKVDAWLNGELILSPGDLPERMVFGEACELMGRSWAVRGLTKLKVQIDEAFGAESARHNGQLAGRAHALVPLAAILGFAELAELCTALEEACRNGHDVQPSFEAAKAAASKARKSALSLIDGLQTSDS